MWRKFLTPFMIWLLQSPLHIMVSSRIMLISVTGRKSGKVYITPVEYGMDKDTVYVVTSQRYKWWKNLRNGTYTSLIIKGRSLVGLTEIRTDSKAVIDTLHKIYPNRNGLESIAMGCVAIQIKVA